MDYARGGKYIYIYIYDCRGAYLLMPASKELIYLLVENNGDVHLW
jgi:hypothetical protein